MVWEAAMVKISSRVPMPPGRATKITQANLQFLADYYLMGRKDKDLSPADLW